MKWATVPRPSVVDRALHDFLKARIAEDEKTATPKWPTDVSASVLWGKRYDVVPDDVDSSRTDYHLGVDPAHAVAECRAKRAILDLHTPKPNGFCFECDNTSPCPTVRQIGAVYATHRDYNAKAWSPRNVR